MIYETKTRGNEQSLGFEIEIRKQPFEVPFFCRFFVNTWVRLAEVAVNCQNHVLRVSEKTRDLCLYKGQQPGSPTETETKRSSIFCWMHPVQSQIWLSPSMDGARNVVVTGYRISLRSEA